VLSAPSRVAGIRLARDRRPRRSRFRGGLSRKSGSCEEDVAFRVIAAQQRPDHATIARFIEHHENAIAGLFGAVLTLCAKSGLANVGVLAVDGPKVHPNERLRPIRASTFPPVIISVAITSV
jgi:hypothetical protein